MNNGIYDYGSQDCYIKVVNCIKLHNCLKIKCALIHKRLGIVYYPFKYYKIKEEKIKHWRLI